MNAAATELTGEGAASRPPALDGFKNRGASRAGENDPDNRRSIVFGHISKSGSLLRDSATFADTFDLLIDFGILRTDYSISAVPRKNGLR
jgi:hypothetical protein